MIDDGRVLVVAAIAAIWGVKNALALRRVDETAFGSQDADTAKMQDLASRIGKPVLSGDLVFHPDGLVTRRAS